MKNLIPTRSHTIRFPGDLYANIQTMRMTSGRTFNGMVVHLLEIGFRVLKKYEDGLAKQVANSGGNDEDTNAD